MFQSKLFHQWGMVLCIILILTATSLAQEAGGKRALIIAVKDYYNISPLEHTGEDARAFAEILMDKCGFKKESITIMTDEEQSGTPLFPSKRNMINSISKIVSAPGGPVIIFFMGQGAEIDDETYLGPAESSPRVKGSMISISELKSILEGARARSVLFLGDACYRSDADSPAEAMIVPLAGAEFTSILSSSVNQFSRVDQETGHAVFTLGLLKAFSGAADGNGNSDADGVLKTMEIFSAVASEMNQWSMDHRGVTQSPVLCGSPSAVDSFRLELPVRTWVINQLQSIQWSPDDNKRQVTIMGRTLGTGDPAPRYPRVKIKEIREKSLILVTPEGDVTVSYDESRADIKVLKPEEPSEQPPAEPTKIPLEAMGDLISGIFWAEAPSERVVLINDGMVSQGGKVPGTDAMVKEIRQSSVLIEMDGNEREFSVE